MKLVLLRHGRTEANEKRLYCGFTDVPLSARGREELLELKKRAVYPDVSGMLKITSGMRRADETLELLFEVQPDVRISGLREMNFGRFEMHSYDELKEEADYQAWILDADGEIPAHGGESARQFRRRVLSAADGICGDALVICHGGVIAALMQAWFPEENKNMYQWQPAGGLGYVVEIQDNKYSYSHVSAEN